MLRANGQKRVQKMIHLRDEIYVKWQMTSIHSLTIKHYDNRTESPNAILGTLLGLTKIPPFTLEAELFEL